MIINHIERFKSSIQIYFWSCERISLATLSKLEIDSVFSIKTKIGSACVVD